MSARARSRDWWDYRRGRSVLVLMSAACLLLRWCSFVAHEMCIWADRPCDVRFDWCSFVVQWVRVRLDRLCTWIRGLWESIFGLLLDCIQSRFWGSNAESLHGNDSGKFWIHVSVNLILQSVKIMFAVFKWRTAYQYTQGKARSSKSAHHYWNHFALSGGLCALGLFGIHILDGDHSYPLLCFSILFAISHLWLHSFTASHECLSWWS